MPGLKLLTALV